MKKGFLILFSIFILFLTPNIVNAASANVQISAPDSVYVGESVTVSVTISSSSSLGSWQYTVAYDDSILGDSSQAQMIANYADNSGKTSVTNTWTFTAKSSGSASFSIPSIVVYAFDDDSEMSLGGYTSTTINVINPSGGNNGGYDGGYSNYEYSDDNNLSSLNIEGFDINFDSSVTEYSISVPNDTKKITVGASANDWNASVSGIGDYDLKEGNNEIKIVVTAENGDTKTYTINVNVKELSPIEVKVDDKTYSVVRKSDKLPKANATYKASTILIKGENVPCYHSDITDIYLVGLSDEKGKIVLYSYDTKNDKFSIYNEINVGGLYISLIDTNVVPKGYVPGFVKIGDKEYNGFLKEGSYSLLYGVNLETGEKNYYSYDSVESTLQKVMASVATNANFDNVRIVIFGLVGLAIFEFIIIIASVISKNRQFKKYNSGIKENNILDDEIEANDESIDGKSEEESDATDGETEELENDEEQDSDDDTLERNSDEVESTDEAGVSFNTEEIEDGLGKTALISKNVNNVFNNTKNRKESIKERKALRKKKNKKDDDMFKF